MIRGTKALPVVRHVHGDVAGSGGVVQSLVATALAVGVQNKGPRNAWHFAW